MGGILEPGGAQSGTSGALVSKRVTFTEQPTASALNLPITAVDNGSESFPILAAIQADGSFTIAGDHRDKFPEGRAFTITGSTGNNGNYTSTPPPILDGGTTIVYAYNEGVTSPIADGSLNVLGLTGSFTVAGDHVASFPICTWFGVVGSTGNDKVYGVISATFVGGNTVIVTDDPIPDEIADGDIQPAGYVAVLDIPAGAVLDNIRVFILEPWAADYADLYCADEAGGQYFNGVGMSVGEGVIPYDRDAPVGPLAVTANPVTDGINWFSLSTIGTGGASVGSTELKRSGSLPDLVMDVNQSHTGPGIRFDTDLELYLSVTATIAAPPVVPTGVSEALVTYWEPSTPIPAVF